MSSRAGHLYKVLGFCFALLLSMVLTGCTTESKQKTETSKHSDYPNKPIRLIVPYAPGGLSDSTGRILAEYLEKELGQRVVVVNIEGAGGVNGSQEVLKAEPDGYTLLWHHHSLFTANIMGNADFTWDAFTPVAAVMETGATMVVRKDAPWKTLQELLEDARSRPGQIRFGVNLGAMSHFGALGHAQTAGVEFAYVGGGGDSARIAQLLRGEIDVTCSGGLTVDYVRSGELRALAYMSERRAPALPEVPTSIEQGLNSTEVFTLIIYGPKGLPEEVVTKLDEAVAKIVKIPEFVEKINKQNVVDSYLPPAKVAEYLASEQARLEEIAKKARIGRYQ